MAKKFKFRYVNEIVGGFVILVVLLLLAGVLVAGRAQHWFEGTYEIALNFPEEGSMDLQKGAEVMLRGAKVGSVQDILPGEGDNDRITGSIRVRGPFMRFIRTDTVAWVKKKMVVTGDAFIELRRPEGAEQEGPGTPIIDLAVLAIDCRKDTEILQMLEEALTVLQMEAENTLRLVNTAISSYTLVADNLNDPQGQLQLLLGNANGLLANATGLLEDMRQGEGLPAKVLNDPGMARDVQDIVAEARKLMAQINAMAADLQQVVAKLPPMADTLAGEVDNLPTVIGDTQAMMRETTSLLDGLQKHWLLRKYMESDDAIRAEEVLY